MTYSKSHKLTTEDVEAISDLSGEPMNADSQEYKEQGEQDDYFNADLDRANREPKQTAALTSKTDNEKAIEPPTSTTEVIEKGKQLGERISKYIQRMTVFVSELFQANKTIFVVIGIVLGIAFSVYLLDEVLDTIDDIPLLKSVLELIGIGYTLWFVFRYLLNADRRSQMLAELKNLTNNLIEHLTGTN